MSLENTYVSIGLLVAALGFTLWISNLSFLTEANAKALQAITIQQEDYNKNIIEINIRLSRIEGYLRVQHGRPPE